jgi:hypothetical protein
LLFVPGEGFVNFGKNLRMVDQGMRHWSRLTC